MSHLTDSLSGFLHVLQQGGPLGAGGAAPLQPLLKQGPYPLALLQACLTHTQHGRQQPKEAFC